MVYDYIDYLTITHMIVRYTKGLMMKVFVKQPYQDEWVSSTLTYNDLEYCVNKERKCDFNIGYEYEVKTDAGEHVAYYYIDSKGYYKKGRLPMSAKVVEQENKDYPGYSSINTPWHEAVYDIIENNAEYRCIYHDGSTFHLKYDENYSSKLVETDYDTEFRIEPAYFANAKLFKKLPEKPKPVLKDGYYYTAFKKDPILTHGKNNYQLNEGWIPLNVESRALPRYINEGQVALVSDGVVYKVTVTKE